MANSWWVIIPQSDAGKPASYLERVDFRVQFMPGSREYAALKARKPISYDGMTWVYWKGPYATEAQAQTAQNPQPSPEPNVPNPLSGLAAIGDFFGRLSEANTWIRVGEVLFGLVLVAVGLAAFAKKEIPVATPIARLAGAVL